MDLDAGPVADVNSERDNPVIGTRSFGAVVDGKLHRGSRGAAGEIGHV